MVAEVLVAVRARPEVGAGFEDGVGPAAVGLEPVVSPAQGREVARAGRPRPAVGHDVVAVAADARRVGVGGRVGCTTGRRTCGRAARRPRRSGPGPRRPRRGRGRPGRAPASRPPGRRGGRTRSRICSTVTGLRVFSTRPTPPAPSRADWCRCRNRVTWRLGAVGGCRFETVAAQPPQPPRSRRRCRSRASWRRARSPTAIARRTSSDSVQPEVLELVGATADRLRRGRGRRRGPARRGSARCRRRRPGRGRW